MTTSGLVCQWTFDGRTWGEDIAATEKWREVVAGWEHTGVGVQFCFVELVDDLGDGLDCAVPGTWSAIALGEILELDERELLTS